MICPWTSTVLSSATMLKIIAALLKRCATDIYIYSRLGESRTGEILAKTPFDSIGPRSKNSILANAACWSIWKICWK